MLQARFERLEIDARTTAKAIGDRRELLDWFLKAKRDLEQHKAAIAAQEAADLRVASAASEALAPTPKSGSMMRSGSAGRMGAEVVASTPMKLARGGSASSPSLTFTPGNVKNSMHSRADQLVAAAERNARQLGESRKQLNVFKDLKAAMAAAKSKESGAVAFNMADPLPPGTYLRTAGNVQRLTYNSRCNFAQNFSLKPLETAVKEVPPPHPVHPTSSMRNRLEACEHRVLWNHQTMTHNQNFLDDYGRFARGEV